MFDQGHEPPAKVDLKKRYDAVIVGSGAAGGMAAYVLTAHGLDVLLLEAGKKLPIEQELRSMEWPYDHPRRGSAVQPRSHAERIHRPQPPYARGMPYEHVHSYVQTWGPSDYSKNIVVDEKDHPYTGTRYAWVRARTLGGKTTIWGRLALRLSDYDFKAASRDGYGEDWPISYKDIEPYYDRVDTLIGISGLREGLPHLPDSLFQRPFRFNAGRDTPACVLEQMGRLITPYRAGVTTDGLKHNRYRTSATDAERAIAALAVAIFTPPSIHRPASSIRLGIQASSRFAPTRRSTRSRSSRTGKASGVSFVDTSNTRTTSARLASVCWEHPRWNRREMLLYRKSAEFQQSRRPQLLRALDGSRARPAGEGSGGQARHSWTTAAPGRFLPHALSQPEGAATQIHSRLWFRRQQRHAPCFPGTPWASLGLGRQLKEEVRDAGRSSAWAASEKCWRGTKTTSTWTPA